jgi:hypothetical protein
MESEIPLPAADENTIQRNLHALHNTTNSYNLKISIEKIKVP